MRAVIQRVSQASVTVSNEVVGQIGDGFLILLGIAPADDHTTATILAEKIANLRIFPDAAGRFDRSLLDIHGSALVVSQFTLFADTRRGRRPSFSDAAAPEIAALRVEDFATALRQQGVSVAMGRFGADMRVALVNDGPVTNILDTETFREPRRS
jgi:D-tyrosyl-tRNA(Tyr) deacylase